LSAISLDGAIRGVRGALPITIEARRSRLTRMIVLAVNAREGAMVGGVEVYPVNWLAFLRDALFIRKFCDLSAARERLLERAMAQQGHGARARIPKVARGIADVEGNPQLEPKHIAEAIRYRTLDRAFSA
jgi:predicted ATPase with chaperone activity